MIALVEDHPRMSAMIAEGLRRNGWTVDCLFSLAQAEIAVAEMDYAIVILDLGMPDGDGQEWLIRKRRQGFATPCLMLTARDSLRDRVSGLNAGADDYLAKPFAFDELIARLNALKRRPRTLQPGVVTLENLEFLTTARTLLVNGRPVNLGARELKALEILLHRQGKVCPRKTLEERLYGYDEVVSPNALEASVSRLRKALHAAGAAVQIKTVRGIGYGIFAKV